MVQQGRKRGPWAPTLSEGLLTADGLGNEQGISFKGAVSDKSTRLSQTHEYTAAPISLSGSFCWFCYFFLRGQEVTEIFFEKKKKSSIVVGLDTNCAA